MALAQPKLYTRNLTPSKLDSMAAPRDYGLVTKIIHRTPRVEWTDILNLQQLKNELQTTVLQPLSQQFLVRKRPPDTGIILFGSPGNGKSMLAKALATGEAFYLAVSGELLTTTSLGEAAPALASTFALAFQKQPCIICIDQIDRVLAIPSLAQDLLMHMDKLTASDRIIVVGETSKVEHITMPVRRRFTKRLFVAGPSFAERVIILREQTKSDNAYGLRNDELEQIAYLTEHFSFRDLQALLTETKNYALKQVLHRLEDVGYVPLVTIETFKAVLKYVRSTTTRHTADFLKGWNREYGYFYS